MKKGGSSRISNARSAAREMKSAHLAIWSSLVDGRGASPQDSQSSYSSEYLTWRLCRNRLSYGVSTVRSAVAFGVVAEVAVKHSCQQSERGFTIHTVLWHRGQCQWITRSCVDERPSADIVFGTRPHSQDNGNVRYSILGNPSSLLQRRNRHCRNVSGEVGVRLNSFKRPTPKQDRQLVAMHG